MKRKWFSSRSGMFLLKRKWSGPGKNTVSSRNTAGRTIRAVDLTLTESLEHRQAASRVQLPPARYRHFPGKFRTSSGEGEDSRKSGPSRIHFRGSDPVGPAKPDSDVKKPVSRRMRGSRASFRPSDRPSPSGRSRLTVRTICPAVSQPGAAPGGWSCFLNRNAGLHRPEWKRESRHRDGILLAEDFGRTDNPPLPVLPEPSRIPGTGGNRRIGGKTGQGARTGPGRPARSHVQTCFPPRNLPRETLNAFLAAEATARTPKTRKNPSTGGTTMKK
ncbi:MAG: hypothetical protein MZV70_33095 [Desulfobacterales bacterium]|nr:hypothetical protein [Desulfobacterales bacterium]